MSLKVGNKYLNTAGLEVEIVYTSPFVDKYIHLGVRRIPTVGISTMVSSWYSDDGVSPSSSDLVLLPDIITSNLISTVSTTTTSVGSPICPGPVVGQYYRNTLGDMVQILPEISSDPDFPYVGLSNWNGVSTFGTYDFNGKSSTGNGDLVFHLAPIQVADETATCSCGSVKAGLLTHSSWCSLS